MGLPPCAHHPVPCLCPPSIPSLAQRRQETRFLPAWSSSPRRCLPDLGRWHPLGWGVQLGHFRLGEGRGRRIGTPSYWREGQGCLPVSTSHPFPGTFKQSPMVHARAGMVASFEVGGAAALGISVWGRREGRGGEEEGGRKEGRSEKEGGRGRLPGSFGAPPRCKGWRASEGLAREEERRRRRRGADRAGAGRPSSFLPCLPPTHQAWDGGAFGRALSRGCYSNLHLHLASCHRPERTEEKEEPRWGGGHRQGEGRKGGEEERREPGKGLC